LPVILSGCQRVRAEADAPGTADLIRTVNEATSPPRPDEQPQPLAAPISTERALEQLRNVPAPAAPPEGAPQASARALAKDRDAWQSLLAHVPELAAYASRFVPFGAKDADEALQRGKRSRSNVTAWTVADGPIAWAPAQGRELWVASGSIGEQSLIAVLSADRGAVRHEASLVIDDRDARVALASSAEHPEELIWSTCYGCPGEGGSIRLGDDGRAMFVYR
jgi:hypothetical protein